MLALPTSKMILGAMAMGALTAIMAIPSQADASTFTGRIQAIRFNTDSTGVPRVSIRVGAHGSPCATGDWFAYQPANAGVGQIWTPALIEANSARQQVAINGSGRCDPFGVEGISDIDVLPGPRH
ncbi:MAG: hypothetical protein U1E17_12495 [Geminicoccaceae bacterium]